MINKDEYSNMIAMKHGIVLKQIEDLTHADSLIQPQPGGNCMNWVMGHLVLCLVDIQDVLGGEHPPGLPDLSHYGYASEPVKCDGPGVVDLHELVDAYGVLVNAITEQLAQMDDAVFDEEVEIFLGKVRRGFAALAHFFHNSYHIGQLEQLRNLAGRTEKVI
jgi:hypothetical protein